MTPKEEIELRERLERIEMEIADLHLDLDEVRRALGPSQGSA